MPQPYLRRKVYWFAYKHPVTGKWTSAKTPFGPGSEKDAAKYADAFIAELRKRHHAEVAIPTVAEYAEKWLAARKAKMKDKDASRLENWILPAIGEMLMPDVRPRHVKALVLAMKEKRAARTTHHVIGTLRVMFRSAVVAELVPSSPVILDPEVAPKKVDADPAWRDLAIYERWEVEQLIADARIPLERRILYALKGLAGPRHREVSVIRISQWHRDQEPLTRLALHDTKTGVPRAAPVHPVLAAMLTEWLDTGWEAAHGRAPAPGDLLVPAPGSGGQKRLTSRLAQALLVRDLKMLGLRVVASSRNRRGHDLRRAFITLALVDGGDPVLLRWVSHGPGKTVDDLYRSPPWGALCKAVSALKITGPYASSLHTPLHTEGVSENSKADQEVGRISFVGVVGIEPRDTSNQTASNHVLSVGSLLVEMVSHGVMGGQRVVGALHAAIARARAGDVEALLADLEAAAAALDAGPTVEPTDDEDD